MHEGSYEPCFSNVRIINPLLASLWFTQSVQGQDSQLVHPTHQQASQGGRGRHEAIYGPQPGADCEEVGIFSRR